MPAKHKWLRLLAPLVGAGAGYLLSWTAVCAGST